jgi:methionyl-tRNA formyltransferase
MKNIAFIAYRNWAFNIFKKLNKKGFKFVVLTSNSNFKNAIYINPKDNKKIFKILKKNKINIVLFYGWSWIIHKKIIKNFTCICLHPSKLPYFKGGSPIQNQIINGLKSSAVTIFKMNMKLDGGDIYQQKKISLNGGLKKIFGRIENIGIEITNKLLKDFVNNKLKFYKQKKIKKIYKRRGPAESEINLKIIKKKNYKYLYNFVRMLQNPYPNPFIRLQNKIIYIYKIKKVQISLNRYRKCLEHMSVKKGLYLKLKDGYAKIISGKEKVHSDNN